MRSLPTIVEFVAECEHAREGAFPGRESVAVNEATWALWRLLQQQQPAARVPAHLRLVL